MAAGRRVCGIAAMRQRQRTCTVGSSRGQVAGSWLVGSRGTARGGGRLEAHCRAGLGSGDARKSGWAACVREGVAIGGKQGRVVELPP